MQKIKEKVEYELCQYCHKPKQKVDCIKVGRELMCDDCYSIHEATSGLLWFLSLFFNSYKKRLEAFRFKVTCANKDCIGYLDGCYVNKHNKVFKYRIW